MLTGGWRVGRSGIGTAWSVVEARARAVIEEVRAVIAGARVSYMVLSPGSARPRVTTPVRPACRPVVKVVGVSGLLPTASARPRKNVPKSGPAAPPVLLMMMWPASVSSAAGYVPGRRLAATASKPRVRLVPWSASRWLRPVS